MKTGINGIALIKQFEGCRLEAYKDSAGIPTIGFGNTYYPDGSKVKIGDKITQQRAEELLQVLLPRYEKIVLNAIKVPLTQNQFDALVCFCWNTGGSNTLFGLINARAENKIVADWWSSHYVMAGGKLLKGLQLRRIAESNLFTKLA